MERRWRCRVGVRGSGGVVFVVDVDVVVVDGDGGVGVLLREIYLASRWHSGVK